MNRDPNLTHPRVLRLAAALAGLWIAAASSATAQELDLQPADFLAGEEVAIRVDDLKPAEGGSRITVSLANRTPRTVSVALECSLYDEAREDLGKAGAEVAGIAAGAETSVPVATRIEGATRAYCLLSRVQPGG